MSKMPVLLNPVRELSEVEGAVSVCPRLNGNPECELRASADKKMCSILPCNTGEDYRTCSVNKSKCMEF